MKKLLTLALLALPSFAMAHDYAIGDLAIMHPVAYETTATAMSGAGYMTVTNNGDMADRIIRAEADFPRVMLHESTITDGVAAMTHLEGVEIPAGATITFEPGGRHVMFMGLDGDPFEVGEEINVKLVFENAGEIDVVFKVEARDHDADKAEDHSGH
jgi:copper(I)-binding protein